MTSENAWYAVSEMDQIAGRKYNTWLITAKNHFLPFHVMACQDARIAITDKPVSLLYMHVVKALMQRLTPITCLSALTS